MKRAFWIPAGIVLFSLILLLWGFTAWPGIKGVKENTPPPGWVTLENPYDGFSLIHPGDWSVEILPAVATILCKPGQGKLTVWAQPLGRKSPEEYVFYSNRSLEKGWATIRVKDKGCWRSGAFKIWKFDWSREPFSSEDFPCYREYHLFCPGKNTVYTFMLKTKEENFSDMAALLDKILYTFKPSPPAPLKYPPPPEVKRHIRLQGKNLILEIPEDKVLWGILNPSRLGSPEFFLENLVRLEEELDFKFRFLITYASWDTEFREEALRSLYRDGRVLMIALQPWWYGDKGDTTLLELLRGKFDGRLRSWARLFKSLEDPVFVRFGNEMNGDWSTWCAWYYGKDADLFKEAWHRVYNIFQEEGASNVVFVFNPHDRAYPDFKWNHYLLYYPGDEEVDWIGLTGYNNGTSYPADRWRGFAEIYDPLYREYMYYFKDKPFMITEFACNEVGGDKAAWIEECFARLPHYPNIRIAVWFNQVDGKWLYPIDSSPESFQAFRRGLTLPAYRFSGVQFK